MSKTKVVGLGCLAVVVVGVGLCGSLAAFGVYINKQQEQAYQAGHQAYQQANCPEAISALTKAIEVGNDTTEIAKKAKQERAECQAFQSGVELQQRKNYSGTLLTYSKFISQYPNSPLLPPLYKQVDTLFSGTEAKLLADVGTCQNLDTFLKRKLIPKPDTYLPPFYLACGQMYEHGKNYTEAIAMYERFRNEYPTHNLAEQVNTALARATFAEAEEYGAGALPEPFSTGSGTGSGPAKVVIQNDSPEKLQIVFSGGESRIEELQPCEECLDYEGEGPENCPEKGPIGEYEMPSGDYNVVVKSISGSKVTPFSGKWNLKEGEDYYSCFFLVTRKKD